MSSRADRTERTTPPKLTRADEDLAVKQNAPESLDSGAFFGPSCPAELKTVHQPEFDGSSTSDRRSGVENSPG